MSAAKGLLALDIYAVRVGGTTVWYICCILEIFCEYAHGIFFLFLFRKVCNLSGSLFVTRRKVSVFTMCLHLRPCSSLPVPEAEEGLFARACSDRTRSNGFKLKEGRFTLDTGKKSFTVRMVRHWKRLPREAVGAPSLEVCKASLDGALSTLV